MPRRRGGCLRTVLTLNTVDLVVVVDFDVNVYVEVGERGDANSEPSICDGCWWFRRTICG